jgi:phosphoglycerol transferase MdoB-like AlkP superfamily enzyme
MLIQGLRVDLIVLGYFFLIPAIVSIWLKQGVLSRVITSLVAIWITLAFTGIIFMEVVTPEFIKEYDVRPNRIFIDYLIYPKEVFSMLWEAYKPAIFIGLTAIAISIYLAILIIKKEKQTTLFYKWPTKFGVSFLIILLGFIVIRSSTQHRPFNPSMVYFSNDNLVNSLTLNSSYSALYAMYNTRSEQSAFDLYGKMAESDIIKGVQKAASIGHQEFSNLDIPTERSRAASYHGKPKNIVILLQESLGARHVGALGGAKLTPNLDQLMQEGWNFTNTYATGTRSVRGIEAVFTGFSPGPSRSVVKLSKSQTNFFSIASLLKRHNYQTQFIYGGESHFDNMKSFFLGNGIEDIHDLSSFTNPKFVGSWGASDEDLYHEAHKEFERMQAKGKPFFSLVFTTSNHSPFDFPDGCLEKIEGERQTVENAIRYSDCALGKFISKAKASNYWKDTIFVVIADHDSRTIGADLVPIEHFRIPALILGSDIPTKVDTRLVSQIDFPPTMLSLAGISDSHPMLGFDLSQALPLAKQRAMLQNNENFAWLTNEDAIIIQPYTQPKIFSRNGNHLIEKVNSVNATEKKQIALTNSLWSSLAYLKNYYKL